MHVLTKRKRKACVRIRCVSVLPHYVCSASQPHRHAWFFFFLPGTTDWSENSSQFWSLPCNELPTNHTLLYITPATAIFLELCQAIRETGIDISLKIAAHFRSLFPHLFIMITIHYTVRSPWGNLKQSGATPGVVVGCHAFAETTWKVWNIHKHFQRVFQKGSTVTREAMYV